jgi:hypothetical protein
LRDREFEREMRRREFETHKHTHSHARALMPKQKTKPIFLTQETHRCHVTDLHPWNGAFSLATTVTSLKKELMYMFYVK